MTSRLRKQHHLKKENIHMKKVLSKSLVHREGHHAKHAASHTGHSSAHSHLSHHHTKSHV